MKNMHSVHLLLLILVIGLTSQAQAEIYKFKDANGRWQFSDKPPENIITPDLINTNNAQSNIKKDLKATLLKEFKPSSKVEQASLSVVTVETKIGSGSGFFITDSGYLITNRHVVRPTPSSDWDKKQQKLREWKEELENIKIALADNVKKLKNRKANIDENSEFINSNRSTVSEKNRFAQYIIRYERDMDKAHRSEKKYRTRKNQYERAKSNFDWNSSHSHFSKAFNIKLKSGERLEASLVKVSKTHDLALLKLDNYATPYLVLSDQPSPRQGTKVFAIGSPLGIADTLATGLVTNSDEDYIYTDTKILPGNSGGPLINNDGIVLGVNSAVMSEVKQSERIGLVLFSKFIRQEFNSSLSKQLN